MLAIIIAIIALLIACAVLFQNKKLYLEHKSQRDHYEDEAAGLSKSMNMLTKRMNILEERPRLKEAELDWYCLPSLDDVCGTVKYARADKDLVLLKGCVFMAKKMDNECAFILPCGFQPKCTEKRTVVGKAGDQDVIGTLILHTDGRVFLRFDAPNAYFEIKTFFERT